MTARRRVLRHRGSRPDIDSTDSAASLPAGASAVDTIAVEEPMELRVDGATLTVTMRTPGHDFDLAAGFLVAEGVVHRAEDIASIRYCAGADASGKNSYNVVDVALGPGIAPPPSSAGRRFTVSSACGVCGKDSIEAVHTRSSFEATASTIRVAPRLLAGLPERLREHQAVFDRTGGVHAAGLFTADGEVSWVREDVGRHNAVDKAIGAAMLAGALPLSEAVLVVSSRASFELVQKAVMAGIGMLVAVSAPSSLAIDLAQAHGVTLAGFVRGGSFNLYSHPERVG